MGSDLYISIEVCGGYDFSRNVWRTLFDGPSRGIERGTIVRAFGSCDLDDSISRENLPSEEVLERQKRKDCPWRDDAPYWVRPIPGAEFVAIVREQRWKLLQDGDDWADLHASCDTLAFVSLVESLLSDLCQVTVWCWESQ